MTAPDRTVVSRSRTWAWRGLAILLLAPLAVVAASIVCAHQRWHARVQGVRFIDHPEMVRGGDAALTVRGYLVATIESDVDFFRMTGEDNGYPQVEASLCDSGRPLRAWRDPLPLKQGAGASRFAYAVMVPMRAKDVDLSRTGEDVCLRFVATGSSAWIWVPSKPVVVPLAADLRGQLDAYARRDGPVELTLDPGCAPQFCQPDFSPRSLQR